MPTIITSGVAVAKAGDNAPVLAETSYDSFIEHAEDAVGAATRYDWAENWATISGKACMKMVEGTVSDLTAINIISSKFTGEDGTKDRIESEDQVNVFRDSALRGISILRDKKTQTFMGV